MPGAVSATRDIAIRARPSPRIQKPVGKPETTARLRRRASRVAARLSAEDSWIAGGSSKPLSWGCLRLLLQRVKGDQHVRTALGADNQGRFAIPGL